MITFDKQCEDCKYLIDGNCTHPYEMYCENCSLWWKKEENND